jgi:hypothetical protein
MRPLRFAFIFLVSGIAVFGTPSACPTSPNGTDLGTLNGSGGCFQVDFTFSSFLSGAGSGNTLTIPALGDVDLWATGGSGMQTGQATANFNTPGSPNWSAPGDNAGGEFDSVLSYVVTTGGSDLTSLSFGALGFTGSGLIDIVESYCLGAVTVAGCAAGNGGSITTVIFGGSIISQDGAVFFGPGFTNVAISEEIIIPNINLSPTSLTSLGTNFDEFVAPEPASFLLLAAGLGTLAVFRRRRA